MEMIAKFAVGMIPFIMFIGIFSWIIWFKVTGRMAAHQERKRERELEIEMRLGHADAERMNRIAQRIRNEG